MFQGTAEFPKRINVRVESVFMEAPEAIDEFVKALGADQLIVVPVISHVSRSSPCTAVTEGLTVARLAINSAIGKR